MTILKTKILQALNYGKDIENTFDSLSFCQKNLLKNYLNPVFNNEDRNKILKGYTYLQNIGKSLYRYNTLQKNNHYTEAEEEKEDIKNVVLKGRISYYKYVWRAENEEHTCDICKELDGQVFDFYDEVPERPHPNCKCTIEVVEDIDGEEEDKKDKIPPQSRIPQPSPEFPQPKPMPPKPPQVQKWILPCNGPITSPYGWRIHPTYGTKKFHDGVDIAVPINTPVKATTSGRVIMSQWYNGYGKYIEIDHGNGVHSFYGHLNSYDVKVGDHVNSGQIIAKSGNTAGIGKNGKVMTTGPHLHFGVHKDKQPINPLEFIRNF